MGNGDIVVGKKPSKKPSSRTPKTVIAETLAKRAGTSAPADSVVPAGKERHCGAMSQQRGDGGTISTPQKFVQLVGCREPKAPSSR